MKQDRQDELLPLVDENGNITGAATRGECHNGSMMMHPVVHLHVFNSKGELYLQKRPEWKDIQPGKWDTAVGGHIDLGEHVEQALFREAGEELGIKASRLRHCPNMYSGQNANVRWSIPTRPFTTRTYAPAKKPAEVVSGAWTRYGSP